MKRIGILLAGYLFATAFSTPTITILSDDSLPVNGRFII
jgi:hypothetical protein